MTQIVNGVLVLPPELEPHREDILAAYFNRYPGFSGGTGNTTGAINIKKDSDALEPQSEPANTFAFKPKAPQRV